MKTFRLPSLSGRCRSGKRPSPAWAAKRKMRRLHHDRLQVFLKLLRDFL
jgi:hypothetical protein